MSTEPLPHFKYHPDPIGTGSIVPTDEVCEVCNRARGYTTSVWPFGYYDLEIICPWCIADGSLKEPYDAVFTDPSGVGTGYDQHWDRVSDAVIEEVVYRTPGFAGLQSERWFTHCGDAAAFLGSMGKPELLQYGQEAVDAIRRDGYEDASDEEWEDLLDRMAIGYDTLAYLFRCLHCGAFGGYWDCT